MDFIGWAWLIIIAVCVIIEAATLGLATIWFAIGALVAWLIYLTGVNLHVQIMVFLFVSIITLVLTRPIAVEKLKIGKSRTNADSLIGEQVKVIETINNINNEGTVKARGQIWSAKSTNDEIIEKDELVVVVEIKGVKLLVKRK
ncbi:MULTISPECIES: NfeD family protein [Sedimentibacter]|uniref:NfeD family protein n=1 Tax=Sedimentibacter hydroxybenzoicus DSM 7310 TaxID=1123245 RepID=A0A974BI12_SEDHY|nr:MULTISPECIES: NfeD family protein [Sedimentibacter]NYB73055.1 NfeD family protein [Sedimentibacter hydroxybenzoicus DSM 7310]HCX61878.1 NfeD family protein [Clostridiales bacterium]